VRLADPRDAWFTASLFPVGQNRQNDDALLGHEIDAMISYAPYDDPGRSPTGGDALMVSAGYGAFITASGARAILSGQPSGDPRILSAAFVQVSAAAP